MLRQMGLKWLPFPTSPLLILGYETREYVSTR
jgi:hypothetical protein